MSIKRLILPIERESRELESRKVIKEYFELKGFEVKLVNSVFFHTFFPFYKPAFVLENDLTFQSFKLLKNLFRCGFKIITHDEEAYGDVPVNFYFNTRVFSNNFEYVEHHFFKGINDYNYFLNKYDSKFSEKASIANNYRFLGNSLSKEINANISKVIDKKRINHKKVVLISSKFSYINRNDGIVNINEIIDKRAVKFNMSNSTKELCSHQLNYSFRLLKSCLKDYHTIIENNHDCFFIIRPHPAENQDVWISNFARYKNVMIDCSDKFISWANAVDIVIHNGSTSGLEAFLIGRLSIYYNPLPFDESIICPTQKISSLYIDNLDVLNNYISSDIEYSEVEFNIRKNNLEKHINFSYDFAEKLYEKIILLVKPNWNICGRFKYVFSRLYNYKLRVYLRKKFGNK